MGTHEDWTPTVPEYEPQPYVSVDGFVEYALPNSAEMSVLYVETTFDSLVESQRRQALGDRVCAPLAAILDNAG